MARGHVRKRGDVWYAVYDIPPHPATGKRRQKWERARTKKEAERTLTRQLGKIDRGEWIDPSPQPLGEYLREWLATKTKLRAGSRRSYDSVIRVCIEPALGKVPLAELTPLQVQRLYDDLRARGLGEGRITTVHSVLHGALGQAVKWQMILRNPAAMVERPQAVEPELVVWDESSAERCIELTREDKYGTIWLLALQTGMRRGELLGLRWRDIDWEGRVAHLVQGIAEQPDGIGPGPLKTASSRRVVPLRAASLAALREERRRQNARRLALGAAWRDHDLVWDRGDGQWWQPDSITDAWQRQVVKLDLPVLTLHGLRHTAITLMLAAGVPIHEVARIVGHSSVRMTERYYHPSIEHLRAALDRMDAAAAGA